MKKLLLISLFVFLSNNVHAFDYCGELEKAVVICCSKMQALDPKFDAYVSHCDVKDAVYDTVDKVFVVVSEKGEERVKVQTFTNKELNFKFDKCLKEHHFSIESK